MGLGTTLKIAFDAKRVQRGLKSIGTSIGNLSKRVAQIGVASAAAGMAALTAGVIAFTISSSQAATSVESLTTQFTTLLGSADKAQERMEEITRFAASTPYEIKELAETSKMLQKMGGDLLATGEGLTMVGDAAAMSGRPLSEVGLAIGRVFNAVTSGTSAGEMVNRLQELGLITGTNKRRFEELAAAQKKGTAASLSSAQALQLLKSVMSQTQGGMDALSKTTEGKLSNMKDNFAQLQVAFGTGINEGLKVALDAVNDFLPRMQAKFTIMGKFMGSAISEAVAGDYEKFVLIGNFIGESIGIGIKTAYSAAMDNVISDALNNPILKALNVFSGLGAAMEIATPSWGQGMTSGEALQSGMQQIQQSESLRRLKDASGIREPMQGMPTSLRDRQEAMKPHQRKVEQLLAEIAAGGAKM